MENPLYLCHNFSMSDDKETKKSYYQKNREKILARSKARQAEHREERAIYMREYAAKNRAKLQPKQRAYREAHREKAAAYQRVYRQEHREELLEKDRQGYAKNKEERQRRQKIYNEQHKEAVKAYKARWHRENFARTSAIQHQRYRQNREKYREKSREYRRKNPDIMLACRERKRARKLNAPVNDFTAAQWKAMKAHYGYRCVYCRKKSQRLTQDHITPLSKGGAHTQSNIVPACRSCNSTKWTGPPLVPVQPLLL
jgi:5-methylcytosine-specific restriction endonuclease McrA